MITMIIAGCVALLFGLLFLFNPRLLIRVSEWSNRIFLYCDEKFYQYRFGLGISLILASLLFFFVAFIMSR